MALGKVVFGSLASAGVSGALWFLATPGSGEHSDAMKWLGVGLVVLHIVTLVFAVLLAATGRVQLAPMVATSPISIILGLVVLYNQLGPLVEPWLNGASQRPGQPSVGASQPR
jgi:cytochrome bd-type quinol oxidase subunit 2